MIIRATQKKMMSKPVTSTRRRVERLELGRLRGPAERRERPQRRAEPGVEHVLVPAQRDVPAVPGPRLRQRVGLAARDVDVAGLVVPGGNAVAPPELAADAPVLDVAHPLEVGLRPVVRHEADAAVLDRPDRRLGERRDAHVPLVGEPGLEHGAAAVAARHRAACAGRSSRAGPAASRSATTRLRASKRSRPR